MRTCKIIFRNGSLSSTINVKLVSRYTGVGELSRYGDELRDGRPGFDSRQNTDFSLLQICPEAHAVSYPMGTGSDFSGVKRSGREDDHSSSTAEVKHGGAIPLLPMRLHGIVLNN
jgi:hypothetical protein